MFVESSFQVVGFSGLEVGCSSITAEAGGKCVTSSVSHLMTGSSHVLHTKGSRPERWVFFDARARSCLWVEFAGG